MKIAFYIHHSNINAGGIYIYSKSVLNLISEAYNIDTVIVFTTSEVVRMLEKFASHPKFSFQIVNHNSWINKFRLALSYFFLDFYTIYNLDIKKLNWIRKFSEVINPYYSKLIKSKVSLLHVPIQYSPIYLTTVPIITTMHDLQELHYPENFNSQERVHRAINNRKSLSFSSHIIVSYNHVKEDIVELFEIDKNKISVCPPRFSENWFTTKEETDWSSLVNKYSISNKYLLYPAATWPHKNHLRLLEALKEVQKRIPDIKLICTGNKTDYYSSIEKKLKELGLEDSVKFLGIVPEEDLIGLYKNTSLVVIPTLYEAGSGPLYEAMRYEVPVICAKTTSLPETIGDERFMFDPKNTEDLANLIDKMLTDDKLRAENLLNSKKRMSELSKYDYFNNFWEVYKKLVNH
ncbi:MAG: glycosyltransferase family 4 protein [Ignavibacterium sp.]|nr:MAG: glycosyltransferase family 4 protein [Ignavibacterium sp.]